MSSPDQLLDEAPPDLWSLPTPILEHILRLTAAAEDEGEEQRPEAASASQHATRASMHLNGLYASSHAGRALISPFITAAALLLDGRQAAHGETCGLPMLAACMQKLTLRIADVCPPTAIATLLSDPCVRGKLARLEELELEHAVTGWAGLWQVYIDPFDLAAIAAADLPNLRRLALYPQSLKLLHLSSLAPLTRLQSLTIADELGGRLDLVSLSALAPLTALSRLDVTVELFARSARSPFQALSNLASLAHLSLGWSKSGARVLPAGLSLLSSLHALTCLELGHRYLEEGEDGGDLEDSDSDGDGVILVLSPSSWPSIQLYLHPLLCLTQLLRLDLPSHSFASAQGIVCLQASLPLLNHLHLYSLRLTADSPHPLSLSSLRHLTLSCLSACPSALLSTLPPDLTLSGLKRLCLLLGTADSPSAGEATAERVRRAVTALDLATCGSLHVELSWTTVPDRCSAACVVAALQPLGRLRELWLHTWTVDGEVVRQVARVAPRLRALGLVGKTEVTGGGWWELRALTSLTRLLATCPIDCGELRKYAGEAPRLRRVELAGHMFYTGRAADKKQALGAIQALVRAERYEWGLPAIRF